MKVELVNFRCWENKTIELYDKGICLLNGKSGKGKSSILNAIVYCITGKGKNISTYSKKTTKVSITIDDMKITRSRGPNRLTLDKNGAFYEDDQAQKIIDSVFGSEFCNTSYIDQDNINSFVYLSPSEKAEFLESLLLSQYNIDEMKTKLKDDISMTKTNFTTSESKINTLKDVLKNMVFVKDNVLKIDKVNVTKENVDKLIEKLKTNIDVCDKNMKTSLSRLKKYETEKRDRETIDKKHTALVHMKDELEKKILSVSKEELKERLDVIENHKISYISNRDYVKWKDLLEETREKYDEIAENNKKELDGLRKKLSEFDDTGDHTNICIYEDCKRLLIKIYELDDLLKDHPDYEYLLKEEKEKQTKNRDLLLEKQKIYSDAEKYYQCPGCHKTLVFSQKSLVLHDDKKDPIDKALFLKEIEQLKGQLSSNETIISDLTRKYAIYDKNLTEYNQKYDKMEELCKKYNIEQDLEWIDNVIDNVIKKRKEVEEINEKIRTIENDRLLKKLEKEVSILEKDKYKYNDINNMNITEEQYHSFVEESAKLKQILDNAIRNEKELNKIKEEIDTLNISITSQNIDELIEKEREKQETCNEKLDTYKNHLQSIEKWKTIYENNKRYTELEETLANEENKKTDLNHRMRCLVKLKDHLKNAERKSLTDFIDSLNNHASLYIEQFFPDEDISVQLKTTMETKTSQKEKISLNFEVQYKQMVGDLSFLSGGEKDRVNLAFTLAFAELVDNRVLLLDECISSLDMETTNTVLEHLKEKYKGNLIILVSHQANLGFFDQVVQL
jgi:exonuclease SbcC